MLKQVNCLTILLSSPNQTLHLELPRSTTDCILPVDCGCASLGGLAAAWRSVGESLLRPALLAEPPVAVEAHRLHTKLTQLQEAVCT